MTSTLATITPEPDARGKLSAIVGKVDRALWDWLFQPPAEPGEEFNWNDSPHFRGLLNLQSQLVKAAMQAPSRVLPLTHAFIVERYRWIELFTGACRPHEWPSPYGAFNAMKADQLRADLKRIWVPAATGPVFAEINAAPAAHWIKRDLTPREQRAQLCFELRESDLKLKSQVHAITVQEKFPELGPLTPKQFDKDAKQHADEYGLDFTYKNKSRKGRRA